MKRSNRRRTLILPLAAAALLGACDSIVDVDPHLEPEGFVIMAGDQVLLTYMLDDAELPTLTLTAGTTYDVVIRMLDHDGHPIPEEHADEDEAEELHVVFAQPIVVWEPEDHGHGDDHFLEFHGELTAVEAGETTMWVGLLHGDHYDFLSANIPVVVQPAQAADM